MKYEIVNVVCTTNLHQTVDIEAFSRKSDVVYFPESYFCVYFQDGTMKSRVSVFPSGKLISVGGKSIKVSKESLLHTQNGTSRRWTC